MPPKVFVVLVVMNLDRVAISAATDSLPVNWVHDKLSLPDAVRELAEEIGYQENLGAMKLVDVVVGNDGTLIIGYRVRTQSHALNPGFKWSPTFRGDREERRLLDRAWEMEKP